MGRYLNPGNDIFICDIDSEPYVDKSPMILELNKLFNKNGKFICMSRARRFGKTMMTNLMSAYYSKNCDSRAIFEGLELGTEATRTGIIDNAIKSGYIDLKKVFKNTLTVNESVEMAQKEINEVFSQKETTPENDTFNGFYGDVVGTCPLCSKNVLKGRYGYGCSGYKDGCNFRISGVICKRVIPISKAKELLNCGETGLIKGFTSKAGKPFDAKLVLENGKAVFKF